MFGLCSFIRRRCLFLTVAHWRLCEKLDFFTLMVPIVVMLKCESSVYSWSAMDCSRFISYFYIWSSASIYYHLSSISSQALTLPQSRFISVWNNVFAWKVSRRLRKFPYIITFPIVIIIVTLFHKCLITTD